MSARAARTIDPDDLVSLCPHCFARHNEDRYTCAFTHGYYTCGPCATRYTMPEVRTKAQVAALDVALAAKVQELYGAAYGDRAAEEIGGMGLAGVRLLLIHDEGWEFPDA